MVSTEGVVLVLRVEVTQVAPSGLTEIATGNPLVISYCTGAGTAPPI